MWLQNPCYNQFQARDFIGYLPTHKLDIVANGFWGGKFERAFFLTWGFLTLFLPLTENLFSRQCIDSMRKWRNAITSKVYKKSNIPRLPHWSSLQLVEWDPSPQFFLQTVGIATCCKVGGTLFYDLGLAPLQAFIFPLTCFHNVHSRSPLFHSPLWKTAIRCHHTRSQAIGLKHNL